RRPWGKGLLVAGGGGLALSIGLFPEMVEPIIQRAVRTQPLKIGLTEAHQAVIAKLLEATTPEARILWEDRPASRTASRWAALLPRLTQRQFLGGLDPDGFIEHASISFLDQLLDGRHISTWSDRQLEDYCRRYNVGWVVAWTPAAIKRFQEWPGVQESTPLQDDVPGRLFTLKRTDRGYALKGTATLLHADCRHITLGDVVPNEEGIIVLSFHWQAGLRAAPSRVKVEREDDGHDPIGLIRLRTDGSAARVTLTWDRR
ncbi:MAG: hypothetical protein NZO58_14770, partial [Gemmataceae bacterium]|nr:hypothetical protein [Gemmataceae bacterium]